MSFQNVGNVHKIIIIQNLLDFSDDYARSAAKSQFWYVDTDATNITGENATNLDIKAREHVTNARKTVETIIPLNRYSLFEKLEDKIPPSKQLEFEINL